MKDEIFMTDDTVNVC